MKTKAIRRSFLAPPLAVLALALLGPAAATAATVSKSGSTLTYNAAAGEANHLVVSLAGGVYTFDDSAATISVAAGCTAVNTHRATCAGSGVGGITINAGDLNDLAWVTTATPATITGSEGNDSLIGNNAADVLIGCGGDDSLSGGGGADVLVDAFFNCSGGGNDSFDGGSGADSIFGGPGTDSVTYASRTAPVFVSLDGAANDGEAGEGDSVSADVENVTGGSRDDDIVGAPGPNTLNGGSGNDVLVGEQSPDPNGAGGNDTILGGAGDDALAGGDGNNLLIGADGNDVLRGGTGIDGIDGGNGDDLVHAQDGVIDSINCGSDFDSGEADTDDVVSPSCEAVDQFDGSVDGGDFTDFGGDISIDCGSGDTGAIDPGDGGGFGDGLGPFLAADETTSSCLSESSGCSALRIGHRKTGLRHGEVAVRLSLPPADADLGAITCKGKLKLSLAGNARKAGARRVKLGSAPFSLHSGKQKRIEVQLSRPGLRLFGEADRLAVRAAAFVNEGGQSSKVASAPLVVKAPGQRSAR